MGANLSKAMGKIFGNKEMRLLMLGLDAAGKTTILYKLKLNQSVTTIPTVGFNVETVTYKNVKFNVWDVGGQDKIRPLWRHYYTGTQGLVFVVDSQDRERIDEAKQELHRILSDREMKECLLLVFANKQDLPGAMSPAEVTEKLGLHRMRDRSWYVHPSCATTGEGLFEGLQWLSQNVKKTSAVDPCVMSLYLSYPMRSCPNGGASQLLFNTLPCSYLIWFSSHVPARFANLRLELDYLSIHIFRLSYSPVDRCKNTRVII